MAAPRAKGTIKPGDSHQGSTPSLHALRSRPRVGLPVRHNNQIFLHRSGSPHQAEWETCAFSEAVGAQLMILMSISNKFFALIAIGFFLTSCDFGVELPEVDKSNQIVSQTADGNDVNENEPIIQGPVSSGSGSSQTQIANADVTVKEHSTGNIVANTQSDAYGDYYTNVPNSGAYDIIVSATGYSTCTLDSIVIDGDKYLPVNLQQ
ncbi:carboxypeptidase-like regulatory domain-containing protein [Roseivirga sp. BDSF3-8]|uniref:carboxypeptidase-like regulatory domain-containing protein n=1 Tax=Roseivirga sp. BDSF3-8 TaxID=3241598 RepID=UPI0035321815